MSAIDLNKTCIPYPEQFSQARHANSIIEYAFPAGQKRKTTTCNRNSPWKQDGSRCSVIDNGEQIEKIANIRKLTLEVAVDLNKKGISLAVKKRVALFFQQAILCYKMPAFTFSLGGADAQIGGSPGMKIAGATQKREAAHSSTIPCLIAHAKDGSTPHGFVYLKGGSYYDQQNATIGMFEFVNGADELLDGKANQPKLRNKTAALLNRVAQGLNPVNATTEFMKAFQAEAQVSASQLDIKDPRRHVLEKYVAKMHKITLAATEKEFYDRMIGVIVTSNHPRENILRQEIYQKRFDIMQLQEVIESRIGKKIDATKKKMGPDGSFLEYILLKTFTEPQTRITLEKLFCKTAAVFEQEYLRTIPQVNVRTYKGFVTQVDKLKAKHKVLIDTLMRDLRSDFRELIAAEFTYRAGVFKTLRTEVNRWTQEEYSRNHLKTTNQKVSRSWVSRMEELSRLPTKQPDEYRTPLTQRRRYIALEDGLACAATFGVDSGVFLPSLFTSHSCV